MGRILFFLLLGLVAYVGYRWWRLQQRAGDAARARDRAGGGDAETMVRCEICGLNLPQSEALAAPGAGGGRWFCCEEHRRQGAASR
jgi:hypothetical protein